jgi:hypothetical protein
MIKNLRIQSGKRRQASSRSKMKNRSRPHRPIQEAFPQFWADGRKSEVTSELAYRLFLNPHFSERSRSFCDDSCFQCLTIPWCDALSKRFAKDFQGFRRSTRAFASVFRRIPFGTLGWLARLATWEIEIRKVWERRSKNRPHGAAAAA